MEARSRYHRGKAQDLAEDGHSPHAVGAAAEVGKVPGDEVRRLIVLGSLVPVLVACGSNAPSADYTAFCAVAASMRTAAQDPHGEDPAAVTDPAVMKETWSKAATIAGELRDKSPAEIKDDVALVVSTVIDTNDLFSAHDYDLVEIAKNEDLRKEFDAISRREGVAEASDRFNAFVEDNCAAS